MYKNQIYYTVTEANILASDNIGTQIYVYNTRNEAEQKLYRLWGYAANPESGDTKQCFSIWMTENRYDKTIMLESKVFDYRSNEPEPEPEPEPEE